MWVSYDMSLVLETIPGKYGTIDQVSPERIPRGAAAASLNWLTQADWIELRRGSLYLGTASQQTGNGKASALRRVTDSKGTQHLIGAYGQKVVYYDIPTAEWIQIGSNILGPAVVDSNGISSEPISIEEYVSPAGNQFWINSPNILDFYKVFTANLGSPLGHYDTLKNFKGTIKMDTNRFFLWNTKTDKTGIYMSWIDAQNYTTESNETLWTGDGATKVFPSGAFTAQSLAEAKGAGTQTGFNVQPYGQITATANISGITQASPSCQITANAHGLSVGQHVLILSVVGMTQINGLFGKVTNVVDANNVVVSIDTTGFTGYGSSGTIYAVELFSDDYNGGFTSDLGGTGTINYATGAVTLSFNTAPVNSGVVGVTYQWENSRNNGIADFTVSTTMGVRVPGSGIKFRQDAGGGPIQNIKVYGTIYYCFHLTTCWTLTDTKGDDSAWTNEIYRAMVGISAQGSSIESGVGIYYIDNTNQEAQRVRLLTYTKGGSQQVLPAAISESFRIDEFLYDAAVGIEWGDYILFAVRTQDSTINNRVIAYNKLWKSWDTLDYSVSCFEIYNGNLVAGDSASNNFQTLFSGFDDNGNQYPNYWIGLLDSILLPGLRGPRKFLLQGLKKVYKFYLRGGIDKAQQLRVSVAFDSGDFIEIGGSDVPNPAGGMTHHYAIEGTGPYVDAGRPIDIGGRTLGTQDIGGNQPSTVLTVPTYERMFLVLCPEEGFEFAQIKFEAMNLGYVSVLGQKWFDVRLMGTRAPAKYTDRI